MATEKRAKRPLFTSPRGIFQHAYLAKADDKFADAKNPDGDFKTSLILPRDAATQAMLDKIDVAVAESLADAKATLLVATDPKQKAKAKTIAAAYPYEDELDQEGDATANIIAKFKINAVGRNKATGETWSNRPNVFNAKGLPLDPKINVYGGSEGRVSFEIAPYYMASTNQAGVSLRLKAAQAIVIAASTGASASTYGFGDEGGFTEEETVEAGNGFEDETSGAPDATPDVDF